MRIANATHVNGEIRKLPELHATPVPPTPGASASVQIAQPEEIARAVIELLRWKYLLLYGVPVLKRLAAALLFAAGGFTVVVIGILKFLSTT